MNNKLFEAFFLNEIAITLRKLRNHSVQLT